MRRLASSILVGRARDAPTLVSSRIPNAPQGLRSFSRSQPLRGDESKPPHSTPPPPPRPRQPSEAALTSALSSILDRPPVGSSAYYGQGPAAGQPPVATNQQQLEQLSMSYMLSSAAGKGSLTKLNPALFDVSEDLGLVGEGEGEGLGKKNVDDDSLEPYHLHVYSHKQNTHVLLTRPNRGPLISLSCGNLGFRRAQRKTYDAAYQLGAYAIDKMTRMGIVDKITNLEIVLKGFGAGREAVTKVLLSNEGSILRDKIRKVSDATVIRFGGPRPPNPRRI